MLKTSSRIKRSTKKMDALFICPKITKYKVALIYANIYLVGFVGELSLVPILMHDPIGLLPFWSPSLVEN